MRPNTSVDHERLWIGSYEKFVYRRKLHLQFLWFAQSFEILAKLTASFSNYLAYWIGWGVGFLCKNSKKKWEVHRGKVAQQTIARCHVDAVKKTLLDLQQTRTKTSKGA